MNYVADKLEELDKYFEEKKESEKWLMILVFAGSVAYLIYSYLFPYTKSLYDESVIGHKSIMKKIHKERVYLETISRNSDKNYRIRQYNNEIKQKRSTLELYKKKNAVIDTNLNHLSGLLFNQKNWSIFLDSITDRAAVNNIEIKKMSNRSIDSNGSFGHVLEIALHCEGKYEGIVHFLGNLEQNELVTDIYYGHIYPNEKGTIVSDINISVWGINH